MEKIQGSHDEWDTIWTEGADDTTTSMQFTRSTPKNMNQFWQKCYYHDIMALIEGKEYRRFLELGAGKGTTSMYLADANFEDITMVDLSESGFELARRNFTQAGLKLPKMIIANCEDTKLETEAYDCIYNIGLLEHFEDPTPTLRETYRLLKPGGLVFMPIVPAQPFSYSIAARLKYHPISIPKYYVKSILGMNRKKQAGGMIRTKSGAEEYLKICREIGFDKLKCIPYNSYWLVNSPGTPNYQKSLNDYLKDFEKKKQAGNYPLLQTKKGTEFCLLLYGTK